MKTTIKLLSKAIAIAVFCIGFIMLFTSDMEGHVTWLNALGAGLCFISAKSLDKVLDIPEEEV